MTLKPANKDDLIEIQKLAKLKILEKRILKDFDFTSDVMMCDVDGNTYGMKDLVMYIDKILTKKAESNKSSKKKKSDKKGKERSDHKHLYIRAEILDTFLGKEYSYVGKVCSVCGKIRRGDWRKEYRASFRGEKADATDLPKYIKIDRDYVRRKEL
jgi:hypothetical protein